MGINEEISAFIEQMFDKFSNVGANYRGTFLEDDFRTNFESFYLQCKYIFEKLDISIIQTNTIEENKHLLAYRKGEIFKKLFYEPIKHIKLNKNPKFIWEEYETDILTEEYVDLIMNTLSSLFEFYISLLQNGEIFDCIKLTGALNISQLLNNLGQIDKANNLEKLYEDLSIKTNNEYGKTTTNIFSMKAYQVRCACFHMSYSYKKTGNSDFKILLDEDGRNEILYTDLIKLTKDILAKLNIIIIVPHFFSKGSLPLKGF